MSRDPLDQAILDAHEAGDGWTLVELYARAAKRATAPEAAGFFNTHAYVFALECGHPMRAELHAALVKDGREA